ncbi:MAG: PLDc N-terminal domain-containing protein [Methanosarcinaceae archaeon]|uniref:PLDc N-terminal domain-containing protein n=1 Tax=unclassified Methanosarcina TaxID=2644672 RepID=UPI00064F1A0B|nr:PLDc N-terminal domain-containing protein [Methanosarcina sp. MTP4]
MSLVTNIWGLLTLLSAVWVIYDVLMKNRTLSDIMKIVWIVVALVFGILGAAAYYLFGRKK